MNTKNISNKCVTMATNVTVPDDMELVWKSALRRYDTNGDGRIGKKELKAAFKSAGSSMPAWRAMRAMYKADKNGDGFIDESEFKVVVKYAAQKGYVL